jgi:hypothetical protein
MFEDDDDEKPWWETALEPFEEMHESMLMQMAMRIRNMTLEERLQLDEAVTRVNRTNVGWQMLRAAETLENAFVIVESEEGRDPQRSEWQMERYSQREKRLSRAKRRLTTTLRGSSPPEPPLHVQTEQASEVLKGKVVSRVSRGRRAEARVEFTDGTELFLDATAIGLDLSIVADAKSAAAKKPRG